MNTQEFLLGLDCLKYGVDITDRDRNRNNRGDINEKENTK